MGIMNTRFNWISCDWTRVKNHCRTTVNKKFTENEPSLEFKRKLLISEHSPIRIILFDWSWEDIPSWVSVHFARHKWEKFISTQRDDRKEHEISRNDMPQGTPVDFDGFANMQNLIDSWRKRLCFQASPETRAYAEDFKTVLHEIFPELADVLVPNCVYRCGCPEFEMCKQRYFEHFLEYMRDNTNMLKYLNLWNLSDIQGRYDIYNQMYYVHHKIDEVIKSEEDKC